MGTRSTVKFIQKFDDGEQVLCSVYQQYDGYIDGVGHDLANFLKGYNVVNGYNNSHTVGKHANGIGCLSAQYVQAKKDGIGGFYMTHANDEQEYNYRVFQEDDKILIEVDSFKGTPEELLAITSLDDEDYE